MILQKKIIVIDVNIAIFIAVRIAVLIAIRAAIAHSCVCLSGCVFV